MTLPKELLVGLPHKLGSLETLARVLADNDINLLGFGLDVTGGMGFLRMVVDRPSKGARALTDAGYELAVLETLAVGMPNEHGSLVRLARAFATAGENILYCYPLISLVELPATAEQLAVVLVNSADLMKAEPALKEEGLVVLSALRIGQDE